MAPFFATREDVAAFFRGEDGQAAVTEYLERRMRGNTSNLSCHKGGVAILLRSLGLDITRGKRHLILTEPLTEPSPVDIFDPQGRPDPSAGPVFPRRIPMLRPAVESYLAGKLVADQVRTAAPWITTAGAS